MLESLSPAASTPREWWFRFRMKLGCKPTYFMQEAQQMGLSRQVMGAQDEYWWTWRVWDATQPHLAVEVQNERFASNFVRKKLATSNGGRAFVLNRAGKKVIGRLGTDSKLEYWPNVSPGTSIKEIFFAVGAVAGILASLSQIFGMTIQQAFVTLMRLFLI